jgi:transforming growth factor-beta-induced protein
MKRLTWLGFFIVLSLVLAACGAAAPTAEPVAEPTEAPAEAPVEGAEEMAEANSIVDIAVEDGRFTTLVAAVQAAGLAETLSGEGQFTVFAPTDEAFAALPEGTVESLLEEPEGALRDILLYHVAEGAVPAETVVTLESATTLQGEPVSIEVMDGEVVLNDNARVIITDIEASNGIIHVIDAVILPPSMSQAAAEAEGEMAEEEMAEARSIAEIAAADGRFTTLLAALEAAGLAETFAGEGAFTVFAPTDEAFASLPEGTVDSLLADPQGALTDVLTYHVVEGVVPAESVVGLDSATTLSGEDLSIMVVEDEVILNELNKVIATDIEASNGIIHVIDGVLLPPSNAESAAEPTIVDIAVEDGRFTTLVAALEAAGLAETLSGEGPFTVFAPVDEAFAALPEGTVESLLEDPQGALTDVLLYHVVDGRVMAEDVVGLTAAPTLQGQEIAIAVDGDGQVLLNDTVQVIITDVEASNGVIHVIDGVLIPAE